MARDCTELRNEITESRVGQTRGLCPAKLRDEILGFAQERRREGVAVRKVAQELGISESGLTGGCRKPGTPLDDDVTVVVVKRR